MAAVSSPAPGPVVGRWERWTHASHRVVLPAAAATGLALGGALALGAPRVLEAYAPVTLIALGAGALTTSLAYRRWRSHPPPVPAAAVVAPAARACPNCAEAETSHREWSDLVRRSWHTPVAPPRGAQAAPGGLPLRPGDGIWQRWAEDEPHRLPVELIGPVPETAWVEPAAGAYVPFPQKEPLLRVVEGHVVPMAAPVSPAAPVPLGLAPPTPVPIVVKAPAPVLPSSAAVPTGAAPPAAPAFAFAPAPTFSPGFPTAAEDPLVWEALHPLPPHLRPEPAPTWVDSAAAASPPIAATSSEFTVTCATCTQPCDEEAAWGPCPECGQPVCPACRIRAVVEYGHTWCSSCGVGRAWELSFTASPATAGS